MPKKTVIVCCLCKGPIVQVQGAWTHLANTLREWHYPMPTPEGKKSVTLSFSSHNQAAIDDFIKLLKKDEIWVGSHSVRSSGDDFIVTVAIEDGLAQSVLDIALHKAGLYAGKTAKAGPRVKDPIPATGTESGPEGGESDMAKAKKAAKKGAPKSKGTTTTRSKAEYRADPNYRECATCGHFVLKTKWDRHLEKHPECRSQKPKAVKATAKKAAKATKAKKKEAA